MSGSLRQVQAALVDELSRRVPVEQSASAVDRNIWFMNACGDLYRFFRDRFADVALDFETMRMLQEVADDVLAMSGAEILSASEWPSGGWVGDPEICIASAQLAKAGNVEDVLVSMVLLSTGFDEVLGSGQSMLSGYTLLIPAICSALAPKHLFIDPPEDLPPLYLDLFQQGEGQPGNPIILNLAAGALAPALSIDERRELLSESPVGLSESEWNATFASARALGLSDQALDPDGEGEIYSFDEVLEDAANGNPDAMNEVAFANLVFWVASESHLVAKSSLSRDAFRREFPWVVDWCPQKTLETAAWPPNKPELLSHIEGEVSD